MRESMFLLASPRIIAESARRISARAVRLSKVTLLAAGVAESAVAGVLFPQPATMAGMLANRATAERLRISPPNRPPHRRGRRPGGAIDGGESLALRMVLRNSNHCSPAHQVPRLYLPSVVPRR